MKVTYEVDSQNCNVFNVKCTKSVTVLFTSVDGDVVEVRLHKDANYSI